MIEYVLVALVFGGGMFLLGWWVRGLSLKPVEVPVYPTRLWRCPNCERTKELPAQLETKVLVCNNCNMKLERVRAGQDD